jgi:hypothetical protein
MNDFGQRGTLRKEREPEPVHWGYKALGMALAMLLLSWVGAWIAQGLAP